MERFWVIGGTYTDTTFSKIEGGHAECRYGPYPTLSEVRRKWAALSMSGADDACTRYRIEREGGRDFWVIGGVYADTGFKKTVGGSPEERIGPFNCREDAMDAWRTKAWATVDDGFVRYRIEQG